MGYGGIVPPGRTHDLARVAALAEEWIAPGARGGPYDVPASLSMEDPGPMTKGFWSLREGWLEPKDPAAELEVLGLAPGSERELRGEAWSDAAAEALLGLRPSRGGGAADDAAAVAAFREALPEPRRDDGPRVLSGPLDRFLKLEAARSSAALAAAVALADDLAAALRGAKFMSGGLAAALAAVRRGETPDALAAARPLGDWCAAVRAREAQLGAWLRDGKPRSVWLPGLLDPHQFLAAARYDCFLNAPREGEIWAATTRASWTRHRSPGDVTDADAARPGAHVHGLALYGAALDADGGLEEIRRPDAEFERAGVLYVSARVADDPGPGVYEAPAYRTKHRKAEDLLFVVRFMCGADRRKWLIRGPCLALDGAPSGDASGSL